jgi:hypothetical protein
MPEKGSYDWFRLALESIVQTNQCEQDEQEALQAYLMNPVCPYAECAYCYTRDSGRKH